MNNFFLTNFILNLLKFTRISIDVDYSVRESFWLAEYLVLFLFLAGAYSGLNPHSRVIVYLFEKMDIVCLCAFS